MLILRRSCEFSLSLQVGLRLYDDLNERMSREEATRIRDFVTTEALKVSLRNKTKCTGKIAFKTCFAKVWLGVSWKPKFFVEFKIISAKFFVSRNLSFYFILFLLVFPLLFFTRSFLQIFFLSYLFLLHFNSIRQNTPGDSLWVISSWQGDLRRPRPSGHPPRWRGSPGCLWTAAD